MTPAWTNWEQFANLNEEETKRAEENRRISREQEAEDFQRLTGQLQNEAQGQAGARQFGGLQRIGKYQDIIKARDAALQTQQQPAAAPWEKYVDPNRNSPYRSPWMDLEKRMGQITQEAERTQAVSQKLLKDRQDAQAAKAERDRQAQLEQERDFSEKMDALSKGTSELIKASRAKNISAERGVAMLLQKYGLNIQDPRVRNMLYQQGIDLLRLEKFSS